jgi:hypothetical protein
MSRRVAVVAAVPAALVAPHHVAPQSDAYPPRPL